MNMIHDINNTILTINLTRHQYMRYIAATKIHVSIIRTNKLKYDTKYNTI